MDEYDMGDVAAFDDAHLDALLEELVFGRVPCAAWDEVNFGSAGAPPCCSAVGPTPPVLRVRPSGRQVLPRARAVSWEGTAQVLLRRRASDLLVRGLAKVGVGTSSWSGDHPIMLFVGRLSELLGIAWYNGSIRVGQVADVLLASPRQRAEAAAAAVLEYLEHRKSAGRDAE